MNVVNCLVGLDIGTSAVKGVAVTADGDIVFRSSKSFTYHKNGTFVLLDPKEFIDICFGVIRDIVESAGKDYRISAICPCCASGNLLFLDDGFKPLTDIIGWQSSVDENWFANYYSEEDKEKIYKTVGWPVLNGFPVACLPWLAENNKALIKNSRMICMTAEYLNYRLTGNWGISKSMGTPFYLLDQEKDCYSKEILGRFGIAEDKLPPVFDKGTVVGKTTEEVETFIGLPADTPVVLGSFDHPSCATGAGVFNCGEMLLSCGTSWVEFFPVKDRKTAVDTGFLVDRYMLDGQPYCVMNSLTSVGRKIDEYKHHYLGNISYDDFSELAEKSRLGCNGIRLDLGSDTFPDLSMFDKCHIARAIIEATARLLKENIEISKQKKLQVEKITLVGGITNSDVCVKIIAETVGKELSVVNGESAGAVGAAMLAGIGIGLFKNEADAFGRVKSVKKVYSGNCSANNGHNELRV